jgi:SAM-dependent methyltransferase
MTPRFDCTLVDLSPDMSALSRELNPACEHIVSDMRTLRLGRQFDAVLVHDAIMYMTSEADLSAALRTAHEHLRPGGALIISPDCLADSFAEHTHTERSDAGPRTVTTLIWSWDPDPNDTTFVTEYVFLLREGDQVKAVHDRHVQGLFALATWQRVLAELGFDVELFARPISDEESDQAFLCRKR